MERTTQSSQFGNGFQTTHQQPVSPEEQRKAQLVDQLRNSIASLQPVSVIIEALREVLSDKEVQRDLARVGLTVGLGYLLSLAGGKRRSFRNYIITLVLVNVVTALIIEHFPRLTHLIKEKIEL